MHVDLQCAESFVVLTEEMHYGRAAELLFVSSAALSRRIVRLERQLAVTLLVRGPTGVLVLTPAGTQALREVKLLLDGEANLRDATRHPRTILTLGVPSDGRDGPVFGRHAVELERLLRDEEPGIKVAIRRVPFPLMTTWVLDGRVDVQVTAGPVLAQQIRSTPLVAIPRFLAVHASSPYADAGHVCEMEVRDLPLLYDPTLPLDFMTPFWLGDLRPFSESSLVPIVARDSSTVLDHVSRGLGATIVLGPQRWDVPEHVRVLPLPDVPPLLLHALTRASDQRWLVRLLVRALGSVTPVGMLPSDADWRCACRR